MVIPERLASSRLLSHFRSGRDPFSYMNGTVVPLVTTGLTNTDITSNSDADDGAANQGMDCT